MGEDDADPLPLLLELSTRSDGYWLESATRNPPPVRRIVPAPEGDAERGLLPVGEGGRQASAIAPEAVEVTAAV